MVNHRGDTVYYNKLTGETDMIDALAEPLSILAIGTSVTMIVIMIIADRQNKKKPPRSPE